MRVNTVLNIWLFTFPKTMRGMWTLSINFHIPRGMCRKLMIFNIFPTFPKTSVNCAQSPGNVHNPQSFWGLYTFPVDCAQSPIIHILRNIYNDVNFWRQNHGKSVTAGTVPFWLEHKSKPAKCDVISVHTHEVMIEVHIAT